MYRILAPEPGREERERERSGLRVEGLNRREKGGERSEVKLKREGAEVKHQRGGRGESGGVVTCSSLEGVMSCTRRERNCVSSVLSRRVAACGMVSPTSDQSKIGRMRGGGGYGCLHTYTSN